MVMHPGRELVGSARNRPQAPVRSPTRQQPSVNLLVCALTE